MAFNPSMQQVLFHNVSDTLQHRLNTCKYYINNLDTIMAKHISKLSILVLLKYAVL